MGSGLRIKSARDLILGPCFMPLLSIHPAYVHKPIYCNKSLETLLASKLTEEEYEKVDEQIF